MKEAMCLRNPNRVCDCPMANPRYREMKIIEINKRVGIKNDELYAKDMEQSSIFLAKKQAELCQKPKTLLEKILRK